MRHNLKENNNDQWQKWKVEYSLLDGIPLKSDGDSRDGPDVACVSSAV